jgi:hypothetical protein
MIDLFSFIKITDIGGRELYSGISKTDNSFFETLHLNIGVYFISITNNKNTIVKKLIKR